MRQKAYAYWLNSAPGIGARSIKRLVEHCGSVEGVYRAGEKAYRSLLTPKQAEQLLTFTAGWDVEKEFAGLEEKGMEFVTVEEPEYPARLKEIPDPPYGLFWKGSLPHHNTLAVAVVGARDCSEYGRFVARELGSALGSSGIQVISGMAKGIDGIGQEAAVAAGGTSYAVLGCGADICYPAQNRRLYETLLEKGGILSQYPPGTQPQPGLFPPRNRIVSGLADAVVVVEARHRSGTLITVDMALEQGREVYAVPGRLTDRLSDGCNRLLKQGAGVVLSPKEFIGELAELFPGKSPLVSGNRRKDPLGQAPELLPPAGLSDLERKVWECLDFYPRSVEQIRGMLEEPLPYPQALQTLTKLCLAEAAQQAGIGYFQKKSDKGHIN